MKVFISWSGARSKQVAFALREWIPFVINDVDLWVSEEDIAKGAHWPTRLAQELDESKFGIICLTPENIDEPWILFEAGALSKAIEEPRVSPYLFDLDKKDVKPPLGHFQSSKADKDDTRKLLQSINSSVENSQGRFLPQQKLEAAFKQWWPRLEEQLAAISLNKDSKPYKRPTDEVLGEILETVRGLSRDIPSAIRDLRSTKGGTPDPLLSALSSVRSPSELDKALGRLGIKPSILSDLAARAREQETQETVTEEENTLEEKKK